MSRPLDSTTALTPQGKSEPVWIFDLDNTLYPASCRLFDQVEKRIGLFVQSFLKLEPEAARALQKQYWREHGTTLNGLMQLHGVDPIDYMDYVHDIDLSAVQPSEALEAALAALPGRKIVYTNGSVSHARRIMDRIGIAHHFETVFDIVAAEFVPKPDPEVFRRFARDHAIEPRRAVFFDDMACNLAPAAKLGMKTVLVKTDSPHSRLDGFEEAIHHVVEDLPTWLADDPARKLGFTPFQG